MNTTSSTSRLFAARSAGAILVFVGVTVYARILGPTEIGSFFLFQALVGILSIPANFGINPAVAKRISEGDETGTVMTTAFLLKGLPIFVVSVFIFTFSSHINNYIGVDASLLLILGIIFQELSRIIMKTIEGELRVGETSIIRFIDRSFWVISGGVFVLFGFGAKGIIYGLLIGKLAGFFVGYIRTNTTITWPSFKIAKSLFQFSKFSLVTNLGGYVYNWMDILLLGAILGQTAVGVYEVVWRVTGVVILFSSSLSTSIFPEISRLNAKSNYERIEQIITQSITPSLYFIIPAFFGVIFLGEEILTLVFGSSYSSGWVILIILMVDKIAQGIQLVLGKALQAIDKPDQAAIASVSSIVVNILLNLLLISRWGIVGAAVGTVIASFTNDILHYRYLLKHVSVKFPFKHLGWCFFSSIMMSAVLYYITINFEISNIPTLIAVIFIGACVYMMATMGNDEISDLMGEYLPYK